MTKTTQNWRRLTLLFFGTTFLPVACLGWLAWRVTREDRMQQRIRVQEQRDQAADLAASALQRVLAEAEERLASFAAAPETGGRDLAPGASLIAFGRDGAMNHAGVPLLYYPVLPKAPEPDANLFAAADAQEFQQNDLAATLATLETLSTSKDPAVSAEALLRSARIRRKLGEVSASLDTFNRLGTMGDVRVGLPAGLVAHQGRALIFESLDRHSDLEREASAIRSDLDSGRWTLSRVEFEPSYDQAAHMWLAAPRPPIDKDRLALTEAAESLWQEWQSLKDPEPNRRNRLTFHAGDTSILALTRSAPEQRTALLMAPRFLESAWLDGLRSGSDGKDIDFALIDGDGRTVLGPADEPTLLKSARAVPATSWTVRAITRAGSSTLGLSNPTKLVLAGILMMALLALASGYLVNRAILRELRVARLQSDFVAAVSHEFRTPLTTVRQLSEMLVKGRISSDDRRQQFYETLLRESDRLHRLVDGLLNFGSMEAGQLKYRFEPINPEKFLQDIVSDFEREVAVRGYHVELHGATGLPAIRADRESLARVFWNLLDNAVKYSPDNHTVWVDLSNGGRRLAVRVRDRGIGIPVTEQKTIFQKFVRGAASRDASIPGTGVGLAIAREIVAAHGGDISVESRPGEGSVFTVLLPVADT